MSQSKNDSPVDEAKFGEALNQWLTNHTAPRQSLKSLIKRLKPKLDQARAKGMTYEQMSEFMAGQGIACSVSTLKAHLATRRKTGKQPVRKPVGRSRNGQSKDNPQTTPEPTEIPTPSESNGQPGSTGGLPDKEY